MSVAAGRTYPGTMIGLGLASGLVLLAAGMPWMRIPDPSGLLGAVGSVAWTGDDVAPMVRAVGLVGLAGIAGTVASRGRGRFIVGLLTALLALFGAGTALAVGLNPVVPDGSGEDASTTWWPWIAGAGCVIVAVAGGLIALLGRGWPGLGSRYQRVRPDPARSPWQVLDHGEDPTA